VKAFVEAGADTEKVDRARNTPEQIARNKKFEAIIEFFESHKNGEELKAPESPAVDQDESQMYPPEE
jgi:hypothetical protein